MGLRELWRDPEFRRKNRKRLSALMIKQRRNPDFNIRQAWAARQTMRKLRRNPEFLERIRKGKDALSPEQRAEVVKAIQSGQSTYDIANDWLIAPSTVRWIKHKEKHK